MRCPVVGTIQFPSDIGAHTAIPLLQMNLPEFDKQKVGSPKDFLAVIGEGHAIYCDCVILDR